MRRGSRIVCVPHKAASMQNCIQCEKICLFCIFVDTCRKRCAFNQYEMHQCIPRNSLLVLSHLGMRPDGQCYHPKTTRTSFIRRKCKPWTSALPINITPNLHKYLQTVLSHNQCTYYTSLLIVRRVEHTHACPHTHTRVHTNKICCGRAAPLRR